MQEGCNEGEDPEESFMLPEWNSDGEEQARKKRRVRCGATHMHYSCFT